MTPLEYLAEAIEAGEFPGDLPPAQMGFPGASISTLYLAFSDDMNAARALHEAYLPGWRWNLWKVGGATVWNSNRETYVADCGDKPARSWFLAQVRALIAKEGGVICAKTAIRTTDRQHLTQFHQRQYL